MDELLVSGGVRSVLLSLYCDAFAPIKIVMSGRYRFSDF